ncbi:MAG: energy-coupling factor transporter transmembrane protein EcfT [Galactobacillus timonensis]|uniref:energy-coupling factor transporter transmembrane component T family protein n=1 Tax=Galactobacillus timonensis TaxID=2041840 RepID=UPI0023F1B5D9|nr:energy-coupling factor transporter transmembrane component T [Galactobacillus timonensis]MCI6067860.1 energy-coupling factor transporter transmembrane protein EcfT [Galactobacillus timonensis]MDD7086355.1 energy-coupling factor transporter transmembrane component T [Galactobacillus timonensis]MDY5222942.1 energy-coupling factor transporter transmembrane component T [Lachnospiraceae bacterium]
MGNVTLGRYIPMDSPIHKMDPRAKIGAMLLMLVAIFFPAGWIGYVVLFAACTVLILSAKLSFRYVWKSLKPMLVMMCFLLIINILVVKTGTVLFSIGSFAVYSDAVLQTAYIVVRLLLMIMVTTTLTATTKPLDMTLGIEDLLQPFGKIGVPYHEIAMLISIALRFIPDLIDETNRILKAQESRGVDMQEGKLKEKIMAILSLIVPLFVSAFQRAEDLANAMEARGYAPGEPRTRYKVLKMRGTDWLLLGFAAGLLVLMIVFAYAL